MAALMNFRMGLCSCRSSVSLSMAPRVSLCSTASVRPLPAQPRPLGGSLAGARLVQAPSRGALVVVANGKKSLGCTLEGTKRKRARVSGFRTRISTKSGRNILKARRQKGRHVLCTASVRKGRGKK